MHLKPRFHYFLIILTIFVGIVLSISAFFASRNWDYQEMQGYFKDKAEHRYALMKMEMELNLHAGKSLKALYVSNQEVTRAIFRDFAQELLLQYPSIQALEWIPRIPDVQRPLYEQQAKREGFLLFHITERDAHRNLIQAARRNEYFPVYFVEPFKGNEVALGFDLASSPARKMALESARDTGNMTISQRVRLVQETAVQYGFLAFVPVYRRGLPSNTLETRREHLQGFVLGVFRVGDIVEKSLAGIQPAGINYVLYDMSAPEEQRHLYSHQSRSSPKNITQEIENNPVSNPLFKYAKTLNVAGREWMIIFTATPDFLASRISWQPWGFFFIGLLLTGLVAGHFLSNLRNMRSLSDMNTQLSDEIEERKRTEEALNRSEMKFRTLYDSTSDAVMLLDKKGFFDCNKATLQIFGCATMEEFCSKHPADLSPPEQPCGADSMVLANQMIATAMEKGSIKFEWMHKRNDTGETFPADVQLNAIELDGKLALQAVVRDITELKRSGEKMEFFAAHDALTGILNRRSLEEMLNRTIARAKRGTFSSLLYTDLDNFKDVNDTLGHVAGDEVLITLAGLLKAELRTEDVVVRLGGDEFAVLLFGIDGRNALFAAERLRSAVEAHPFEQEGRVFPLSLSIGLIEIDGTLATGELMSQADAAMYRAKAQGKNRMVVAQAIPTTVNRADGGSGQGK